MTAANENHPGVEPEAADGNPTDSLLHSAPSVNDNDDGVVGVCLASKRTMTATLSVAQHEGLAAARHLIEHGVPVFIARPAILNGVWDPRGGSNGTGYWIPHGWPTKVPDLSIADSWTPGDALCALMGVVVDGCDVDPRSGGTASQNGIMAAGMWPTSYGTQSTPSAGSHDLIRSIGVASKDAVLPGFDVKAGTADGTGRGFVFIAPTMKMSKTTGEIGTYRWVVAPHLDEIVETDDSGAPIAHLITTARMPTSQGGAGMPRIVLPDVIRHHERDDTMWRYACSLRARGMSISAATKLMEDALSRCEQPPGETFTLGDALAKLDRAWNTYAAPETQPGPTAAEVPDGLDLHGGQLLMAGRLVAAHGKEFMFVHGIGWHYWTGTHWSQDDRGACARAVHSVLGQALVEALDGGNPILRREAHRCETASGIAGIMAIASTMTAFARTVRDLDCDPHLINLANGTLDLRTRQLHDHNPNDQITKIARAAYRPDTLGATWPSFLNSVLPDAEVQGFLQRLMGVGLLGTVIEHILAILTGTGANGKGTTYKAFLWALGDYAATAEPDLFMHREGAHPTGEMDLRGRRFVVVSESDKARKLAEATMKRLTGGDPIKARLMRQDFVEFEPSHLAMLITNHLPGVSGDDPAIWRRIRVIPFTQTFAEEQQDTGLDDRLRLDADAVFSWMVDGYVDYLQQGLDEPSAVRVATDAYQLSSDAVGRFIADRCLTGPHCRCSSTLLFDAWTSWCHDDGTDPGAKKAFGMALEGRGFTADRTRDGRFRAGIHLVASPDEAQPDDR